MEELKPTIAKWEFVDDYTAKCSVCGEESGVDHDEEPPFCQWCGVKMGTEIAAWNTRAGAER